MYAICVHTANGVRRRGARGFAGFRGRGDGGAWVGPERGDWTAKDTKILFG